MSSFMCSTICTYVYFIDLPLLKLAFGISRVLKYEQANEF